MTHRSSRMFALATMWFGLVASSTAQAESRTLCAYDPAGKSGDYFKLLEEFTVDATSWGAEIELKAYTDEETAVKDYEAGQCDGVVASGVRLQRFNRFPTTMEAVGALPTYALLKQLLSALTNYESAAKRLVSNDNETIGVIPVGTVHLFVNDRSIDTVAELAGKRIATFDYDKPSLVMVDRVGAIVVPADLGSIGPKFNNGDVDICYLPVPAYQPFELWRGIGEKGGIVKLPLAQGTLQVMVRHEKFPDGFGNNARKWFLGKFDSIVSFVNKAEAEIPAKYWIEIPAADMSGFDEMFLNTRLKLRDEVGAYDKTMLGTMRKLRCGADASRAECAEQKE